MNEHLLVGIMLLIALLSVSDGFSTLMQTVRVRAKRNPKETLTDL